MTPVPFLSTLPLFSCHIGRDLFFGHTNWHQAQVYMYVLLERVRYLGGSDLKGREAVLDGLVVLVDGVLVEANVGNT